MTRPAHLEVGFIARVHGLGGTVAARTFDPASQVLAEVRRAYLILKDGSALEVQIDDRRVTPKEWLLSFRGVDDRSRADRLVGAKVMVFREDVSPPRAGEYFQGDLLGLKAVDESGARVGTVEEIWNTGPVPNLVIRSAGQPEIIVPFTDEFVPAVDLEKGTLVLRAPEFIA